MSAAIPPLAPERFHFDVETHVLPNGLRVLLMKRPELPIVSVSALIDAGQVRERREEAGLAAFTAGVLALGTTKRNAVRLAEDVDALGMSLGAHADYDFAMAGVSGLSRDLDATIEVLSEVVLSPAFLAEEVERRRSDILTFLERRKDDPVDRVRNRFLARIYGDHPYGRPKEGTVETLAHLGPADLRGFYHRFYRPNDTTIALVGDVETAHTLALLSEKFGAWARADVPAPILPPIPEPHALAAERIHKDGMTQATLRIGMAGIRRNSPDYVPAVLLNFILGGSGFGSRLMKRLREEQGLTYGVHSTFQSRRDRGYFFAGCQTALARMNDALAAMFEEIIRLRDGGVTEGEMDWARRYFSGSLPLGLETNDQLATRVLEREFFGLEDEFWLKDIERMRTTTREEVDDVARRLLVPAHFTVVALADFRGLELVVPQI